MSERKSKEQFIKEAKLIHGDKYDYSEVEYLNTTTAVKIFCKECQRVFYQTPKIHLRGSGCNLHSNNKRKTKEQFVKEAKLIHGDKYDYSEVEYLNANIDVKIFCKNCQRTFYQTPSKHINTKRGCNCYTKRKLSNLDFIKEYEHCKTKENYLKEYEKIISNKIEYGGEIHHIKPRSLFPELKDDNSNLVRLSFEDHYRAHFLLYKIYNNTQMATAFYLMLEKTDRTYNPKLYKEVREKHFSNISKQVYCYELDKTYSSIREAALRSGLKKGNCISYICKNKKADKTSGGYHWCYLEDKEQAIEYWKLC